MFIPHDEAFSAPSRNASTHSVSVDRRLVAKLLVSVYSGVLKEPLPDRLERLVRELEMREAVVRDR
jgi:hypothetical protein